MPIEVNPIAYAITPYRQKFAIPRQPGLVVAAKGELRLIDDANDINSVRGLQEFSHLWLIFSFHETREQGWKPTVRPPRLGGNEKTGVFATRSTFRPNGIGLSVVKNDGIRQENGQVIIDISGMDLLNNTPVLDIKPYIPYSDTIQDATGGFAQTPPEQMHVVFDQAVQSSLQEIARVRPEFIELVTQILSQDPRPAYHASADSQRVYHLQLWNIDVHWCVEGNTNRVVDLTQGRCE